MPSCNGTGSGFGVPTAAPPGSDPPQSPPPDPTHLPTRWMYDSTVAGTSKLMTVATFWKSMPRATLYSGSEPLLRGEMRWGGDGGGEGNPVSVGTRSPGRGTPPQHRRGGTRSTATARGGRSGTEGGSAALPAGGHRFGGTRGTPVAPMGPWLVIPTAPQWHPQPPSATQGSSVLPTAPQCHQWVLSATHSPSVAPTAPQWH